ncbi:hypothetical protein VZ95_12150 [Elstera litoralis]|uniref:Uncharacterized protein n=1 Tax=Elstera litoralis TaxID=552518 RepID=A0A0F3IS19_9PROT|nr:hypothetical protein [Elstera litoralis]KJV09343.1 hypothetical protein VZ95_12150 [Elstera litoralis]
MSGLELLPVLLWGLDAIGKATVGEAVKDAYKALKAQMPWAADSLAALEQQPQSKGRQMVLQESLEERPATELAALEPLAQALLDHLRREHPAPVGVDIRKLEAVNFRVGTLSVEEGTGVRIEEAKLSGDVSFDQITVGKTQR